MVGATLTVIALATFTAVARISPPVNPDPVEITEFGSESNDGAAFDIVELAPPPSIETLQPSNLLDLTTQAIQPAIVDSFGSGEILQPVIETAALPESQVLEAIAAGTTEVAEPTDEVAIEQSVEPASEPASESSADVIASDLSSPQAISPSTPSNTSPVEQSQPQHHSDDSRDGSTAAGQLGARLSETLTTTSGQTGRFFGRR
jgi:hypothetical protein